MIIGLTGKARAGKDTIASYLVSAYGFTHEAFANPLKHACAEAFYIPQIHFFQNEIKEIKNPFWGVSPREIAQFVGTEMFRDTIAKLIPWVGNDFWVLAMKKRLDEGDIKNVVITDCRFQNEVDFVYESGGFMIEVVGMDVMVLLG